MIIIIIIMINIDRIYEQTFIYIVIISNRFRVFEKLLIIKKKKQVKKYIIHIFKIKNKTISKKVNDYFFCLLHDI